MKYIFFICIILVTSISHTYASSGATTVTLRPSLTVHMQQHAQRVTENAKKAKILEAREKILAKRAQNTRTQKVLTKKTTTPTTGSTITQKSPEIPYTPIPEKNIYASASLSSIKNVDVARVRDTWVSWTNTVRISEGLNPYSIDERLNNTATEWSQYSKDRGYIIHGRPGDGCVGVGNYGCYNFSAIDTWFKARGVDPIVINRSKHTENIGYGTYRCTSTDCTDSLISSIRSTFDFFMSEKGKAYDLHYKSIIQPNFSKIGVGIVVDESKNTYYLTIHYITK